MNHFGDHLKNSMLSECSHSASSEVYPQGQYLQMTSIYKHSCTSSIYVWMSCRCFATRRDLITMPTRILMWTKAAWRLCAFCNNAHEAFLNVPRELSSRAISCDCCDATGSPDVTILPAINKHPGFINGYCTLSAVSFLSISLWIQEEFCRWTCYRHSIVEDLISEK